VFADIRGQPVWFTWSCRAAGVLILWLALVLVFDATLLAKSGGGSGALSEALTGCETGGTSFKVSVCFLLALAAVALLAGAFWLAASLGLGLTILAVGAILALLAVSRARSRAGQPEEDTLGLLGGYQGSRKSATVTGGFDYEVSDRGGASSYAVYKNNKVSVADNDYGPPVNQVAPNGPADTAAGGGSPPTAGLAFRPLFMPGLFFQPMSAQSQQQQPGSALNWSPEDGAMNRSLSPQPSSLSNSPLLRPGNDINRL